jgi:hypothetical protein
MAARLEIYGSYRDFYSDNVVLTQRMLEAVSGGRCQCQGSDQVNPMES